MNARPDQSFISIVCRLLTIATLAIGLAALPLASTAHAATFVVNTTSDTVDANPGDGVCADSTGACSLRAAIREANTLAGDDVITLPAGTYTLTIAGAGENADATGDLDIRDDLILNGAGAASTIIDGNQLDRVLDINISGGTVVLDGVTITNGKTPNADSAHCEGGGIYVTNTSLTLRNSVVSGNTNGYHTGLNWTDLGCFGSGIYRLGSGTVTIDHSVIRDNRAGTGNNYYGGFGGGLYNESGATVIRQSAVQGNASGYGGGSYPDGDGGGAYILGGSVTIEDSTLSGNSVGAGSDGGDGGGIYYNNGALTIRNSTLSGNVAASTGGGGALYVATTPTVNLIHSTVTGNTANWGGGIRCAGTLNMKNSVVAGNDGGSASRDDCYTTGGVLNSQGYNVVGAGAGCPSSGTGDQTTNDAKLGPLQDNGGPTQTHALLWGSPALEVIPPGANGCGTDYTADQRGVARPGGGACDVGAYESPNSYWDGGGADNNTSTAANWSADALPDAGDIPAFSNASSKNATVDAALHVAGWLLEAAYGGTITQGGSSLTVDGDWTQTGGTFAGGSAGLNLAGAFDLSGGTFTAPAGLMTVGGGFHHTGGTFDPNGGRVLLDNRTSQTLATTFNDLTLNDGLLGYWKLDEGSGATAADASGYGHDGALSNSPIWTADAPATMDFYDPYSLGFSRTDPIEYVLTGDVRKLDEAQTLTLSAWVKLASTPAAYMRFITVENEKAVIRYSSGALQFYMKIDGVIRSTSIGGVLTTIGQWYHVAGTYDGSALHVFLDGTERNYNTVSGAVSDGNWVRLSHASSTEALDGLLDDVRVYDRALSAGQIADLAAGKHPQTSVATTTLAAALDVNGDLTLNSGTLDVSTSNYAITLAGDFTRNGGIFTPRSGAVTVDGAASQTLDTDAITFYNLTVNPGATLITRKNFTASGALTNNGALQQTKPFVYSGTSWFFTGGYQGVQMLAPSGTNLGDTTLRIRGNQECTATPDTPVQRCWDITAATPGQPAAVHFYFTPGELAGNDCNTLLAYHWDGSIWRPEQLDTSWGGDGRVCESAPYSVRVTGVTAFSPFVLKSPAQPAVVTGLAASDASGSLRLDWTAVTQDLDGYGLAGVTYNVYRGMDDPFFDAGAPYASGVTDTWYVDTEDVIGDPAHSYYYLVRAAANGLASADSYRAGTFAFGLTPGSGQ